MCKEVLRTGISVIVTDHGLDDWGKERFFFSVFTTALFSGLKWQGHEADFSLPSTAEIIVGAIPPSLHISSRHGV
jgi:hypothetical protein